MSRREKTPDRREKTPDEEQQELLEAIRRRLGRLTVVVVALILMVAMLAVAVYGDLINYFGYDAQLRAAATLGSAVLGFAAGYAARWLQHRR